MCVGGKRNHFNILPPLLQTDRIRHTFPLHNCSTGRWTGNWLDGRGSSLVVAGLEKVSVGHFSRERFGTWVGTLAAAPAGAPGVGSVW
jgi:hypothetical protein